MDEVWLLLGGSLAIWMWDLRNRSGSTANGSRLLKLQRLDPPSVARIGARGTLDIATSPENVARTEVLSVHAMISSILLLTAWRSTRFLHSSDRSYPSA